MSTFNFRGSYWGCDPEYRCGDLRERKGEVVTSMMEFSGVLLFGDQLPLSGAVLSSALTIDLYGLLTAKIAFFLKNSRRNFHFEIALGTDRNFVRSIFVVSHKDKDIDPCCTHSL